MMRKLAFALVGLSMALPAVNAAAQGTTTCEARMNEIKPLMARVTDVKMKQTLTDRWTRAETAMKANDEKACLEHVEFVTKSLKEGKVN